MQARFALRPTAPRRDRQAAHQRRPAPSGPRTPAADGPAFVTKPRTSRPRTPAAATAFGERTVRHCGTRVLARAAPKLRLPAAASAVGASWQPPALWRVSFHNCPRSRGTPGPITARPAADVAANGRCGRAHPTATARSTATARPMARPVSQPPAPRTSCPPQLSIRAPLVGSGFPRRSAQKSDQLNAGRFGGLSLWQFADYAQIIQRVPSGDDRARRPAGGA